MMIMQLKCGAPGCDYTTEEVAVDIAWGLLQYHRQDNHPQQGGGGAAPRQAAPHRSSKKPERPDLDMDMSEGDWGIFEDCWARYKDNTGQVVERLENKQYLVKFDGSGRVLLRTRGHLRKIEPCTRSCAWPDLLQEDQDVQQETGMGEAPLLIPGAVPAGKVIHPVQGQEDGLQGADQGVGQEGGSTVQQEPARGVEKQGHGVPDHVEEPAVELERRRSPRVRKQKRDKDFHYY